MARFLIRRAVLGLFVMWFATMVVFALSRAAGDPRYLFVSEYSTREQWDEWGVRFGLDRPYPMQYLIWLGKAVQGNFGESIYFNDEPKKIIGARWVATAQLAIAAYIFALIVGCRWASGLRYPAGQVWTCWRAASLWWARLCRGSGLESC